VGYLPLQPDAKLLIFASGMTKIGEESGHLSDRRLPLPDDMIGNHAEPDQKAQRRAYHQ